MHVFAVWLYKSEESRELSEGGCPGFFSKKDESCAEDATCLTVAEKKITIRGKKAPEPVKFTTKTKQITIESGSVATDQHLCFFFFVHLHNWPEYVPFHSSSDGKQPL